MPPVIKTENKYGLDWVLLNNRWYCVQNYSPTKLSDDTDIPIVTDGTIWIGLTTPARCVYNNSSDSEFIEKYGYLYNRYAVDEGLKMPCADCAVPSRAEWESLRDWLIASGFNWDGTTSGIKIGKSMASSGGEWDSSATAGHVGNNQQSNNSSGLTRLPAGWRNGNTGNFSLIGSHGFWWTNDGDRLRLRSASEQLDFFTDDLPQFGWSICISAIAPVVTYNSNGGSVVDDEVTFIGELATQPTAPTKAGYKFAGWYKEDTFVNEWDFDTDTVTADTTLYAKWDLPAEKTQLSLNFHTGLKIS